MNLSICIPTYNQAAYLAQAVRSAHRQVMPPDEIIVYNDSSTDHTADVLAELALEIPTLRVVHQPLNRGITGNTDDCLRAARGRYVVRLDSDDCLAPTYTQELYALMEQQPEAGYAHTAVQELDQDGRLLLLRTLYRKPGFQSADDALRSALSGYRVAANILMFRRTALEQVNYMAGRPGCAEDYHLSVALAAAGFGNIYLNKALAFYRVWLDAEKTRQRRKVLEINGHTSIFAGLMEAAYRDRGWSRAPLKRTRTSMACQHADCLAWPVFTADEKAQLAQAIRTLSSGLRVECAMWLYANGFGYVAGLYPALKLTLRAQAKKLLVRADQ